MLKPLAVALIMRIIIYNFDVVTTNVFIFIIVPGAVISYGILLYLFKVFDINDLSIIKGTFKGLQR